MPIITLDDLLSGNITKQRSTYTLPKPTPSKQARTRNYIHILPHEIKVYIFQLYIENILDRTTSLAFHLHHPGDRDRYHDAVIAGKLLAAGNKLLDGVPDAAGDVKVSVQLLVKEKLKEQRHPTASAEAVKRLEVELKVLTQLSTRCVRLLSPAEEANPEPKPFGYEFNEDGTFYEAGGDYEDAEDAEDGFSSQSTIRVGQKEELLETSNENSSRKEELKQALQDIRVEASPEYEINVGDDDSDSPQLRLRTPSHPFDLTFGAHETSLNGDLDVPHIDVGEEHVASTTKQEEEERPRPTRTTKKEESWSWPATNPVKEEKRHPISLMEDLESYGYRLNAEGTVWIAPKRVREGRAFEPSRPIVDEKEENSQAGAVKDEQDEPEPFGYRFNGDGTFVGVEERGGGDDVGGKREE